jgi:pyruvyltransferase
MSLPIRKTIDLYWFNKVFNFGDQLNPYLIPKLFNVNVRWVDSTVRKNKTLAIGSILARADSSAQVWGSGFISATSKVIGRPNILAVRGPLTRRLLVSQGISCPQIYGDPALLLPSVYSPKITKKFKVGIIPHYVDYKSAFIESVRSDGGVKIINIQNKNVEQVVTEIASCEILLSSSLHGLIVADAYGIPNMWIKISNGVVGGNFKFNDYFASVGRTERSPITANSKLSVENIVKLYQEEFPKIELDQLLKNNPFK